MAKAVRFVPFPIATVSEDSGMKFAYGFYKSLPNAEFETVDAETGRPTIPIPGPGTMGTIILAVLSSTVLSDTIKTTLKKEPTRINQNRDLHTKRQREEAVDLRRPQY